MCVCVCMCFTVVEVEEEAAHVFVVDFASAVGFILRDDLQRQRSSKSHIFLMHIQTLTSNTFVRPEFLNEALKKKRKKQKNRLDLLSFHFFHFTHLVCATLWGLFAFNALCFPIRRTYFGSLILSLFFLKVRICDQK